MANQPTLKLESASLQPPQGLAELLEDLGDGENGFGGTPVYRGTITLEAYLQQCRDGADVTKIPSHLVPQTVFWVLDEADQAIGMVRMRHYLNEKLQDRGGHIGYYLKRAVRGRGYGKIVLKLALAELQKLGKKRAMLTVDQDNFPSIKVITANGGRLESTGHEEDGTLFGRYWIDLA